MSGEDKIKFSFMHSPLAWIGALLALVLGSTSLFNCSAEKKEKSDKLPPTSPAILTNATASAGESKKQDAEKIKEEDIKSFLGSKVEEYSKLAQNNAVLVVRAANDALTVTKKRQAELSAALANTLEILSNAGNYHKMVLEKETFKIRVGEFEAEILSYPYLDKKNYREMESQFETELGDLIDYFCPPEKLREISAAKPAEPQRQR